MVCPPGPKKNHDGTQNTENGTRAMRKAMVLGRRGRYARYEAYAGLFEKTVSYSGLRGMMNADNQWLQH